MKRIDRLLHSAIEQQEVLRSARAWLVLKRWSEVVGPSLATKSAPDRYDHGTVFVAVVGSVWAVELRMRKDEILARLRSISGEPSLFHRLRFGVRSIEHAVVQIEPVDAHPASPERLDRPTTIRAIGERLLDARKDAGGD